MLNGVTLWAYFGTIYLLTLTYQDYKDKCWVDDRKNYFMMGLSIGLLYLGRPGWLYFGALFIASFGFGWALKRFQVMGEADANSLSWIFWGFGLTHVFALIWFFIVFSAATLVYHGAKWAFRYKKETPFYYVILLSFVITCLIWGLY